MSVAPQSSSSAAPNDAPPPTSQARSRPEKVLAKGPFWARLPALRTMTSTVGGSQSQAQESGSPVPPIALPDRISSTRILLSDTQACIQKLSARMDIIGSRSEQALKEMQLAREALETGSEKTVAEIADVVYRCQATLIKSIGVQESILDKINENVVKLTISSDALLKLYEAHNASLASLTQTMHGIMNVQQSAQVQHTQLVGAITPLEPLVRTIPVHIDALVPAVERIIERSLERALSRLPIGTYMREQIVQGPYTPRGQKRQRLSECEIPPVDTNRTRRRSTMTPADLLTARNPSSPLLDRQQSRIRSTERLQTRGSLRRLPTEAAHVAALMEAEEETPVLHGSFSHRTSRRPTLPMPDVSSISGPTNKRPRTESATHTATASGDDVDALQASFDVSCNAETAQPTAVGAVTNVPTSTSTARPTRTIAKAKMVEDMITTSRVPFGSPPGSVNNGLVNADELVAQTSLEQAAGSENVQPILADKNNGGSSKTKSKTPKKKGAVPKKGRGRPKKATIVATPASGTIPCPDSKKATLSKSKSTSTSKDTSPKRATTGNSETSLVSAASVHGPPNSPSTHTKSSPVPFVESNNALTSPAPAQVTVRNTVPIATNIASFPKARTLISLIDASQESSVLAGQGDGGLTAALAHIDNDVNFTSGLGGAGSIRQENVNMDTVDLTSAEDTGSAVTMFDSFRKTERIPSEPGSTLFKGRTKRFLVIDNDSTGHDILDELFAE
ncbi:hypothetical protein A7U60_g6519 [Sanghuangporus baumii]|uniref:Uncharacterized protein n=1 Tax=Sanghuangporus baumii TaxID=108892 RepID=A0A9Q5N6M7_SANBA|nr:hypothetical protein A7U60_g6519 [Sanghuangporus baumii]